MSSVAKIEVSPVIVLYAVRHALRRGGDTADTVTRLLDQVSEQMPPHLAMQIAKDIDFAKHRGRLGDGHMRRRWERVATQLRAHAGELQPTAAEGTAA